MALLRRGIGAIARIVATTALAWVHAAIAHDLWIEPSSLTPRPGDRVDFALRVGEHLVGDPVPRNARMIRRFSITTAAGERPVGGRNGSDPAGAVRVMAPGWHVVAFHSAPYAIELGPDKFNEYLREEGLDRIVAMRAANGESGRSAREHYTRCAKSLVLVGEAATSIADRVTGLPLELVAERTPRLSAPGDALPVQLLFRGRPLEGALVMAVNRLDPQERHAARSDAEGRVQFALRSGGLWLVKAVHMERAADRSVADWESWWASLTFEGPVGEG